MLPRLTLVSDPRRSGCHRYRRAGPALLVFYRVLVVQLSDVLQYIWGKLLGRRRIAPRVSPNQSWEGFVGGVLSATAVRCALWWATRFSPAAAAAMYADRELL
jgi:phosphatidate cytidylyltransferase